MGDDSKKGDSGSDSKKPESPKRPDIQGWVEKGQKPGQTKEGETREDKRGG